MFLARLAREGVDAAMSDKVVLPSFQLPRDQAQRAFRLLWFTVGLVVLGVFGLGAAVWRHQQLEAADAARTAALLTPPPPPSAPPVTAAPATAVAVAQAGAQPAKAGEVGDDAAKAAAAHKPRH